MRFNENAFVIPFMAYTGNRPRQIVQLRLEDFRPAQNAVAVNPAAEKSSYHRAGVGRDIILDRRLTKYFKWLAARRELVYDAKKGFLQLDGTQAHGLLFPSRPSSAECSKLFRRVARDCVRKDPVHYAHLADVSAYSLRHTAATDFANAAFRAGFDLKMIADHLGCTVMTLIRVYLKSLSGRVTVIGGKQIGEVMQTAHMQKPITGPQWDRNEKVVAWPGRAG